MHFTLNKKCILRFFLKFSSLEMFFSESGSAFQSVGLAYLIDLAPNVTLLTFVMRRLFFRSALVPGSGLLQSNSLRYTGVHP